MHQRFAPATYIDAFRGREVESALSTLPFTILGSDDSGRVIPLAQVQPIMDSMTLDIDPLRLHDVTCKFCSYPTWFAVIFEGLTYRQVARSHRVNDAKIEPSGPLTTNTVHATQSVSLCAMLDDVGFVAGGCCRSKRPLH